MNVNIYKTILVNDENADIIESNLRIMKASQ